MPADGPILEATRCSVLARRAGEPLAGTAPHARTWLALEQPGPWGRKALLSSHLDESVGAALTAGTGGRPVTAVVIRRPGAHPDDHRRHRRALFVGGTDALGESWLEHTLVADPREALDLDLDRLAAGERPGLAGPVPERLLLVCTNARRDRCCALEGRPVAAALELRHPGAVWESSHLGGHRFAPTVLSLPDGYVYGGPAAASLTLVACRGRSALSAPAQAAELAVLQAQGAGRPAPLEVRAAADGEWLVRTGREWRTVRVKAHPLLARPESCGADPVPGGAWSAEVLPRP